MPNERGLRRTWRLIGADGQPYDSDRPGMLGGHRHNRIYGRIDCPRARAALARGGYAAHRVFFADEQTAIVAGYRPCAVCMRSEYERWKVMASSADPLRVGTRPELPVAPTHQRAVVAGQLGHASRRGTDAAVAVGLDMALAGAPSLTRQQTIRG
jgi:hypothetical protein